jgi:predicted TIM-barrel fold metal-dependent hydrolase
MRGTRFMGHAGAGDIDLNTLDVRQTFRDHVFGCFIDDKHGIASVDEIGADNIMCETDYPHSDSTWPNCIKVVKELIHHLPQETQYKILRGNAERLYRFTPAEPPVLARA